jgi:TonB-dependent SusC/RagA subfamily outer membrane receptor
LEGQVPGLQAVSSSGQPGSTASIRIRGIGSVSASSNPLFVVDGIPFDGNINSISPNDIESISVLKDATASSLYGSRGQMV